MLIPLHASCARKPSSPRFFLWHPYLTVSHHMNNIKNQIKNNHHLWWKIKKKTKTITARPKSCLPFLLPTSEAECVSTRATDEYELWGMLYMCETTVYPQEPLMNMNYEVCCTCVKPQCIHKSHWWIWTMRYVVHVWNHTVSTRATDEYELWGMLYMCETTLYPQEPPMNMNSEVCCTCTKPHVTNLCGMQNTF